ncbi:hypothetical protein VPH35_021167 [Triticum aestivum]
MTKHVLSKEAGSSTQAFLCKWHYGGLESCHEAEEEEVCSPSSQPCTAAPRLATVKLAVCPQAILSSNCKWQIVEVKSINSMDENKLWYKISEQRTYVCSGYSLIDVNGPLESGGPRILSS